MATQEVYRLRGEVSERAELLNGSFQLTLDGDAAPEATAPDGGPWLVSSSLAWRLGREGEVDLEEGDLAVTHGARECFAVLDAGTARLDPDTGVAHVTARFVIDGVDGDWGDVAPGETVACDLEVDAEDWHGKMAFAANLP